MSTGSASPRVAVIVVAAGSGSRLGRAEPKAFVALGREPILAHALRAVAGSSEPAQVIVVAPSELVGRAREIAERAIGPGVLTVAGGATRQQSVAAGLALLDDAVEVVLVHDAARALAPSALIDRVAHRVAPGVGVVPGVAVIDTLKRLGAGGSVGETVDRDELMQAQTPQGFPRDELVAAYAAADHDFTDDAALYADAGHPLQRVAGDPRAFKITTPADLERAEALLATPSGRFRVGSGLDVHAFDASAPLWLGGLFWPDEPGLAGHSDGDALIHAVCDALLAAAGLGDIGSRFGTADPRFAGAPSEVFLGETLALVADAGYVVGNVAVQLIGNRPRLASRRAELEAHLTRLVGAPVSVAATTTDGLGFTGRGEGIAASATALLLG